LYKFKTITLLILIFGGHVGYTQGKAFGNKSITNCLFHPHFDPHYCQNKVLFLTLQCFLLLFFKINYNSLSFLTIIELSEVSLALPGPLVEFISKLFHNVLLC
jgi:hypothetical protein